MERQLVIETVERKHRLTNELVRIGRLDTEY